MKHFNLDMVFFTFQLMQDNLMKKNTINLFYFFYLIMTFKSHVNLPRVTVRNSNILIHHSEQMSYISKYDL